MLQAAIDKRDVDAAMAVITDVRAGLLDLLEIAANIAPPELLVRICKYVIRAQSMPVERIIHIRELVSALIDAKIDYSEAATRLANRDPRYICFDVPFTESLETISELELAELMAAHSDIVVEPNLPKLLEEKDPHAVCILEAALRSRPTQEAIEEVFDLLIPLATELTILRDASRLISDVESRWLFLHAAVELIRTR